MTIVQNIKVLNYSVNNIYQSESEGVNNNLWHFVQA